MHTKNIDYKKYCLIEASYYTGRPVLIEWLDDGCCCNVIYCNVTDITDDYFDVVYLKYQSDRGWTALTDTISFDDVIKVSL